MEWPEKETARQTERAKVKMEPTKEKVVELQWSAAKQSHCAFYFHAMMGKKTESGEEVMGTAQRIQWRVETEGSGSLASKASVFREGSLWH